ncbi:hypothetical protein QLX67_00820 [Balneolaceae bacterium ANBcel3]|nr:hypothetical protein [Balneolaceae bacterium ANBcel3]
MRKKIVFILLAFIALLFLINLIAGHFLAKRLDQELQDIFNPAYSVSDSVPSDSISYGSITVNPLMSTVTIYDFHYFLDGVTGFELESSRFTFRIPYKDLFHIIFYREYFQTLSFSVCLGEPQITPSRRFKDQYGVLLSMLGIPSETFSMDLFCVSFKIDEENNIYAMDNIVLEARAFDLSAYLEWIPGSPPQIENGSVTFVRIEPEYQIILDSIEQLIGKPIPQKNGHPHFTFSGRFSAPEIHYFMQE